MSVSAIATVNLFGTAPIATILAQTTPRSVVFFAIAAVKADNEDSQDKAPADNSAHDGASPESVNMTLLSPSVS